MLFVFVSLFCLELLITSLQFELPEDARSRVRKISVIRNLCLKVSKRSFTV